MFAGCNSIAAVPKSCKVKTISCALSAAIIPPQATPCFSAVVALNGGSFAHSVMVNVGKSRFRKGNAVTTNDGLVGIVVDVGPKHSQIFLITDINAMIPVIFRLLPGRQRRGLNSTSELRFAC